MIRRSSIGIVVAVAVLGWGIAGAYASIEFKSTSEESAWQVAVNPGQPDGQLSSFQTHTFVPATAVTFPGRESWIANNALGTNGGVGFWTFFVFRQTFDLTGYDPTTANLEFKWAADDAGLDPSGSWPNSGTWKPKYTLNGGSFVDGVWPGGVSYFLSDTTVISSGFVAGLNTLDFYVEGNGVTDGLLLETESFTAEPLAPGTVPEPATFFVWSLIGLVTTVFARRSGIASSATK